MASVTDTPRARGDGDAPHLSPVTPDEDVRTILINRVSWGAVFAGVVIALVVQLVLNLLGIGLGAASFDPATSDNPSATTFSIGAGIWWAVSGILAALAGGYAAGRLAGEPKEFVRSLARLDRLGSDYIAGLLSTDHHYWIGRWGGFPNDW